MRGPQLTAFVSFHSALLLFLLQPLYSPSRAVPPPAPTLEECIGVALPARLSCGQYGIERQQCTNLACCFDPILRRCFFPAACEQFAILAGGYSALLLLPGRDRPGRGSMAMLAGGNWCARDAITSQGRLDVELSLPGMRLVYLITTHSEGADFRHPFLFLHSEGRYRKWTTYEVAPSNDSLSNTTSPPIVYAEKIIYILYASRLKVQPKSDRRRSCVKVDVVTCPGEPPVVEIVNETTWAPPVTTTPSPPPEVIVGIDDTPAAIAMGTSVVVVLAILLAFLFLIDLPTYKSNLTYMKKSIESYLRHRYAKTYYNGTVCRDRSGKNTTGLHDNVSVVSDELLLSSLPGFDVPRDLHVRGSLVHPEYPDEISTPDWMTESDDASLVQYETVF